MTIRARLTLWYSAVLFAGLAVFAGGVWFAMSRSLSTDVDQAAFHEVQSLNELLVELDKETPAAQLSEELEEFSAALPKGSLLAVQDASGAFIFSTLPNPPATAGSAASEDKHWNGSQYRLFHSSFRFGGQSYRLTLGSPLATNEQFLRRLGFLLTWSVPLILVLATMGGLWLSRRALKPVDELARAAETVGIRNLSQRLPVTASGDEIQRLSESWNTMLGRLEAAVQRLSQFTADASHELRTPLALIHTSAELALRRARSPESYQQTLEEITLETERMSKLVDDLLFLARCDSGPAEMPMQRVDLAGLVNVLVADFRALAESKNIQLAGAVPESAPVGGNPAALRRLVLILLDNALKYTEHGGAISVRLFKEANRFCLEVRNSGAGIPEPDLPHIFERFYRADKSRSRESGGYGLGLSLAAGIARLHGAEIQASSRPGEGAAFRVIFSELAASEAGEAVLNRMGK